MTAVGASEQSPPLPEAATPDAAPDAAPAPAAPDPFSEIRLTALSATRGANFWSRRAITRIDLLVGAFDDISSADLPEFTDPSQRCRDWRHTGAASGSAAASSRGCIAGRMRRTSSSMSRSSCRR
jgi:hypothetical protein